MKFKHCMMLGAFFASLLIAALLFTSKPMSSIPGSKVMAISKNSPSRMVVLQTRHTPRQQVAFHPAL